MDGLSSATAIIALIQVATKLIGICWQYKGVKGAAETAKRLINQLEGLKTLLVKVDELLYDEAPSGISRRKTFSAWATAERLSPFHEALKRLEQRLRPADGIKAAKDVLLFPLRQKDLEETLGEIERMKSSLNLALTVDQTAQLGIIETGVLNVQHEQMAIRDERRAHLIQKWLAAPRVAANQMQKQSERQNDTGVWLLRLPSFEQWLIDPNTLLWLHGIPGSGKSVLCSTVYQHTQELAAVGIDKIAIYFYFDVSEESKRSTDSMLRSLISQLAHHKTHNKTLNDIYDDCQNQKQAVTSAQLLTILFGLIDDYLDVVISIDAVDEAADAQDTVRTIMQIHRRKSQNLHVVLTSRSIPAFETSMTEAGAYVVELSIDRVEHDISLFVKENVGRSQKWPEAFKSSLSERIIRRAAGLFRLAKCLIDLVAGCRTTRRLNELLESLPSDLNAVYERILLRIPIEERQYTKRMLEWLAFGGRPLRIGELTHALAVDHANLQSFAQEDLDVAPFESPLLCSSLVTKARANFYNVQSVPAYYSSSIEAIPEHEYEEVRLAHASVREYLLAEALKDSAASDFYLDSQITHRNIAETCLLYLLTPDLSFGVASLARHRQRLSDWPLLLYAANFWPGHVNKARHSFREETWELVDRLFETRTEPRCGSYGTWATTMTPPISLQRVRHTRPLYYAASFGLAEVTKRLLDGEARLHINELGGRHKSTPLQVAAYRGRLEVVKILLAAGADPNLTIGSAITNSTLCWAIVNDHASVATYLIEHGATVLKGEWAVLRKFDWSDLAERSYQLWRRCNEQ